MHPTNLHLPEGYQRGRYHYFSDMRNRDEFQNEVYALAREQNPPDTILSVLDFGCGSAFKLEKHFSDKAYERCGVDVVANLQLLRQRYPDTEFYASIPAGVFDVIIAADVLEHVEGPCHTLALLALSAHPGTRLYFSTPARERLRGEYDRPLGPPRNEAHVQEWSTAEFTRLIADYFDVVNVTHHAANTVLIEAKSPDPVAVLCTGRSGSKYLAERVALAGVHGFMHEKMGHYGGVGWPLLVHEHAANTKFYHQVRNPYKTISSLTTHVDSLFEFVYEKMGMVQPGNRLHAAAQYWMTWNAMAEKKAQFTYRVEDADAVLPRLFPHIDVAVDVPHDTNTRRNHSFGVDDIRACGVDFAALQAQAESYGYHL